MTDYRTSMDRRGYNAGRSMLEVFVGQTFIQGFDRLGTTAEREALKFLDSEWETGDLVQYRDELTSLLELGDQEEILSFLDQYGLSFWPVDEDPRIVFGRTLTKLEERLAEHTSA